MIKTMIRDDAEAKAIADAYGVTESMLADAEKKLPEALAAKVGITICAKRAAPVDTPVGPFEFVFIIYMAGFIEGENGWAVFRWSDVSWDELPQVADELVLAETKLLPQAIGTDTATARLETYRKEHPDANDTWL